MINFIKEVIMENLEKLSVESLKALAYDTLMTIEQLRIRLQQIQAVIQQKTMPVVAPPSVPSAEGKKVEKS